MNGKAGRSRREIEMAMHTLAEMRRLESPCETPSWKVEPSHELQRRAKEENPVPQNSWHSPGMRTCVASPCELVGCARGGISRC